MVDIGGRYIFLLPPYIFTPYRAPARGLAVNPSGLVWDVLLEEVWLIERWLGALKTVREEELLNVSSLFWTPVQKLSEKGYSVFPVPSNVLLEVSFDNEVQVIKRSITEMVFDD